MDLHQVKAAATVSVNLMIYIFVGVRTGVRFPRGSARKNSCPSVGLSTSTMLYMDPVDSELVLSVSKLLLYQR